MPGIALLGAAYLVARAVTNSGSRDQTRSMAGKIICSFCRCENWMPPGYYPLHLVCYNCRNTNSIQYNVQGSSVPAHHPLRAPVTSAFTRHTQQAAHHNQRVRSTMTATVIAVPTPNGMAYGRQIVWQAD